MKTTTENQVITPEAIVKSISVEDIQSYRNGLRKMMDLCFLHCIETGEGGSDTAYAAYINIDPLLVVIQQYHTPQTELTKVSELV
jgi:hypothetical protein